jgi:hypothetical protein
LGRLPPPTSKVQQANTYSSTLRRLQMLF